LECFLIRRQLTFLGTVISGEYGFGFVGSTSTSIAFIIGIRIGFNGRIGGRGGPALVRAALVRGLRIVIVTVASPGTTITATTVTMITASIASIRSSRVWWSLD